MSEQAPIPPRAAKREADIKSAIFDNHLDTSPDGDYGMETRGGRVKDMAIAEEMAYAAKPLIDEVIDAINNPDKGFLPAAQGIQVKNRETGYWQQFGYKQLKEKVVEANRLADTVGGDLQFEQRKAQYEQIQARKRREAQQKDGDTVPVNNPEDERSHTKELFGRINAVAKKVVMYTALSGKAEARRGQSKDSGRNGLQTFGDVTSSLDKDVHEGIIRYDDVTKGWVSTPEGERPNDLVETVQLNSATEPVFRTKIIEEPFITKRLLTRKLEMRQKEVREQVGTKPIMMTNSEGKEEPAVDFIYTFDPGQKPGRHDYDNPVDAGYTDEFGRMGNHLYVKCRMPESQAAELRAAMSQDPTVVRQLAETLVVDNIQLSKDTWENGSGGGQKSVKPPYQDLPPTHTIKLLEPAADDKWIARPLAL